MSAACAIALTVALGQGPQTAGQVPTPLEPWPDQRPLTKFLPNLWDDLVALPSVNSAWVIGVGGGAAAAVHPADDDLADWAEGAGSTAYTAVGDFLGNPWTQFGGALATYVVGKAARRPQVVHLGGDLIRAQTLTAVLTATIKLGTNRTRPDGGTYAFPSAHTSQAFASAAVLHAHYGWKTGIPAYAVAGFVGWTRVRDRAHWVSDVAFGAAVGLVSGLTVTRDHRQRTWMIVPTAGRRGAGLMVVKIR